MYNQLLYVPMRAWYTSFSKVKNGFGHLIKVVYLDTEVPWFTQLVLHAGVSSKHKKDTYNI